MSDIDPYVIVSVVALVIFIFIGRWFGRCNFKLYMRVEGVIFFVLVLLAYILSLVYS